MLHAAAIAYNLSRAAGILAAGRCTRAKMRTLREKLVLDTGASAQDQA
jgi:hypothetical protein